MGKNMIIEVFFIIFLITVVLDMCLFDYLVRWEYEHHRDQWEKDGKPSGYIIWCPKESIPMQLGRTEIKHDLNFFWTFKMPQWAAESIECRRWFFLKRICDIVSCSVLLVLIILLFR